MDFPGVALVTGAASGSYRYAYIVDSLLLIGW